MVFSTQIFLLYFLPLVILGYYLLPRFLRNGYLTLASYCFYGWLHPWFVWLMLASTLVDWACGRGITAPGARPARRRALVGVSVIANLGLLGFFKYGMFAQENLNRLLAWTGQPGFEVWQITLPLGISFYTFQSMSYTIDLYRGHARRARSLGDFACYVALFPQLVAGPIVRYRDLDAQLRQRPERGELLARGALTFILGFAKKVVIANSLAEVVGIVDRAEAIHPAAAWMGLYAYALQLYFDFSGYSDMAIGLGRMFGFEFPANFRSPYRSASMTEFWSRWHISLSTWLRDYLYVPLGGNRRGPRRTYLNLMIVMGLGGLWHGATWNLALFGLLHGAMLAAERSLGRRPFYRALSRPVGVWITVTFFALTLVLFRADTWTQARAMYAALLVPVGAPAAAAITSGRVFSAWFGALFLLGWLLVYLGRETRWLVERGESRAWFSLAALGLFAIAIVMMVAQAENPFIYFRF